MVFRILKWKVNLGDEIDEVKEQALETAGEYGV